MRSAKVLDQNDISCHLAPREQESFLIVRPIEIKNLPDTKMSQLPRSSAFESLFPKIRRAVLGLQLLEGIALRSLAFSISLRSPAGRISKMAPDLRAGR